MTWQAIMTKYFGPTNFKGSRVKAKCAAGSLTLEWDDRWNSDQNHIYAAMQLAKKLGWPYSFHHGVIEAGDHVFVCEGNTVFTCDYEPHVKAA